ncbi:MAG: hypothetical protein HC936_09295 [Leptolyngbyaceae cyanobacterium SU_3_3]|nr:hypothetical protein [Leptolyngbyaceae cyanobacterium SU_3_3]NJR51152.1 hypothetical protein [Leptolyngbyaceae cyanobacterium CSU_1_3]
MLSSLTTVEVGQQAIEFLMLDLEIPTDDQEWFSVLSVRAVGETWHVVEVGVEGLPDKWVLQVYDTGECDPSYTFSSPVDATEADTGLEDMPEAIAHLLTTERSHR